MIGSRNDKWIEHRWSGITLEQRRKGGTSRIIVLPVIKRAHSRRLWEKIRRQKCHQTVSGLWSI